MKIKDHPQLYEGLATINSATYDMAEFVEVSELEITDEQGERLISLLTDVRDRLLRFTKNLQLLDEIANKEK